MAARSFLLLAALGDLSYVLAAPSAIRIMDAKPGYSIYPDSTPYCSWWWDNNGSISCEEMPDAWGFTWDDFVRWNPSLSVGCNAFKTSMSFCVEAVDEPPVTSPTARPTTSSSHTSSSSSSIVKTTAVTSSSTTASTSAPPTSTTTMTTTTSATQTVGPNGIATPLPIQGGMVSNCNKFAKVNRGDTCDTVALSNGRIATKDFVIWNSGVGGLQCSGLQAGTYACVGVTGTTTIITTTTSTTPTATVGPNGITTPLPIQTGMVASCNKFVKVNPGDTCDVVAFFNGPISTENFVIWNAGVGGMQCNKLQAGTYACVGVTSTTNSPTTTVGPNGISTPLPTQAGMVTKCNKFAKVNPGDTCDRIAFFNGPIATETFVVWNSGVGGMQCNRLEAGTYACVGVTR